MAKLKISRRNLVAGVTGGAVSSATGAPAAEDLAAGFPAPITAIPFGAVSHWLQPWRQLCRTRSLQDIENGIGVVIDGFAVQQDALDMLRQQGFRKARVEIGWGLVDPTAEDRFTKQTEILAFMGRLRQAGLRPLILLNAYDGNPCPYVRLNVQLAQDATAGARSITLVSTAGLLSGYSGFERLPKLPSACPLVTGINGQEVSLSMPLPTKIPAGTTVAFVTLNYEPFSEPGSSQNERTLAGWLRYVDLVCDVAIAGLGCTNSFDRGFDLEIWNELSFGSRFLSINNYYDPQLLNYNPRLLWGALVQRTAAHLGKAGTKYQGVAILDGFSSTIPWPASTTEPPEVSAITKHPYPPHLQFPQNQKSNSVALDAFGKKTDFVPSYKCYFPEFFANVILTESMCRDLTNNNNKISSVTHGRLARTVGSQILPVDVWITEIGCNPWEMGNLETSQFERQIVAFTARSLFFYLGIGAARVYLFEAFGGTGSFGLADHATPTIPSTALLTISRLLTAIRGDSKAGPAGPLAPITLTALHSATNLPLFEGNGTPNLPPMTTADGLVCLPIQVNQHRIAILYYIMTRDIRVSLDPQNIRVSIQLANIPDFALSSYDPLNDVHFGIDPMSGVQDRIELELSTTDIPKVLILSSIKAAAF